MRDGSQSEVGESLLPGGPTTFWLTSVAGIGLLALLYLFEPTPGSFFPRCPLNAWTGLYCAGCGTQRALHQLLHGNLEAALRLNALMVAALPLLLYAWVTQAQRLLGRAGLPPLRFNRWHVGAALVAVVLFMVLRNLPGWPFVLLAP